MRGVYNIQDGGVSIIINIGSLNEEGQLQYYFKLPALKHFAPISSSHDLIVLIYVDGYILSNPVMQDLVYLPRPTSWDGDDYFPLTGVGFVSSHGKYKVMSITRDSDAQHSCEVFTVGKDNSWRKGKSPPSSICFYSNTPYVDGNLHMLSVDSKESWNVMAILQFNLEKEAWDVMTLPDETRCIQWDVYLREIQSLLSCSYYAEDKSIEIWMLRDYANKIWSKDFVIDVTLLQPIMNSFASVHFVFPLDVMTDGRILLQLNSHDGRRWFYFDPRDRSCQLVDEKALSAVGYAENLVPVCGF
jgi:F-box interacting protein